MNILIIEDEAPAYRRLQRLIESNMPDAIIIDVFDTVKSAIDFFEKEKDPDLIFMDIQLADGLSFEIFDHVEITTPIIFTTAYDEYALKAFEVNSIDYLLKPVDETHLKKALNKWRNLKNRSSLPVDILSVIREIEPEKKQFKSRFLIRHRDQLLSLKSQEIAYWILDHGTVKLIALDGRRFIYDKPLDEIENQIDPELFFRLNRQCIANIEAIESALMYDKSKVLVKLRPETEQKIVVSREKASEFKKWMDFN